MIQSHPEPRDCPRCGAPMVRMRYCPSGLVARITCLRCDGVAHNTGPDPRLRRWLRRLFRDGYAPVWRIYDRTDLRRWLRWRALRGLPV